MNPMQQNRLRALTRRTFLGQSGVGLGAMALQSVLADRAQAEPSSSGGSIDVGEAPLAARPPQKSAKANAVIYLHLSGGPPSLDLFDYKPELVKHNLEPCPDELFQGQRFAFIKGHPKLLGTPHKFHQFGEAGTWVSELLPHFTTIVDDACVIRSLQTDQFNHAPAELFIYTGSPRAGGAAFGSWLTYGLGTENQNLPAFIVLLSGGTDPTGGKSLWSSGFLPSVYQGVQCRSSGEPILFSSNPDGMSTDLRRRSLDALRSLNELEVQQFGDPETITRIEQFELAYRMQQAVPTAFDIAQEPKHVLEAYGAQPGGASFANNCLLARRMVERGVRYVQLYDWGWDMHGTSTGNDLVTGLPAKCKDVDRAAAALVRDLKQRGMLDTTLVVCGGEFGRTPLNEERNGSKFLGRDHHPNCFSIWMAGGGIKPGMSYGMPDDFGYNVTDNVVTVRDLQATMLHLMGMDPYRLHYRNQGLNQRLIGPTDEARIMHDLLA